MRCFPTVKYANGHEWVYDSEDEVDEVSLPASCTEAENDDADDDGDEFVLILLLLFSALDPLLLLLPLPITPCRATRKRADDSLGEDKDDSNDAASSAASSPSHKRHSFKSHLLNTEGRARNDKAPPLLEVPKRGDDSGEEATEEVAAPAAGATPPFTSIASASNPLPLIAARRRESVREINVTSNGATYAKVSSAEGC